MTYQYCSDKNQRLASAVCENNLASGKCKIDRKGICREVRTVNISEEERERRSEAMKNLRKRKEV